MLKRVLPLFAAFALVFAASCSDDEGAETDDTTETTAEQTTSTTEAPEALALDEWVEEADDVCADADDAIDDLPGETAEEAAEAIPDAIEIAEGQLEDIQALGVPDEEAEAVEEAIALLEDQVEVLEGMQEAIDEGDDPETVFDDAATDGEDIIADLDEIADDLGLEACGSDEDVETTTTNEDVETTTTGGSGAPATGDPVLDSMLEACLGGNGVACDQAYFLSEAGSEAEAFADTCGGTAAAGAICSPEMGGSKIIEPDVSTGFTYGDDPEMDALQDACADGELGQCDLLFLISPIDSDYELFGGTCGELYTREDSPYSCVAGE